jgi:hypothetical protein
VWYVKSNIPKEKGLLKQALCCLVCSSGLLALALGVLVLPLGDVPNDLLLVIRVLPLFAVFGLVLLLLVLLLVLLLLLLLLHGDFLSASSLQKSADG